MTRRCWWNVSDTVAEDWPLADPPWGGRTGSLAVSPPRSPRCTARTLP